MNYYFMLSPKLKTKFNGNIRLFMFIHKLTGNMTYTILTYD